MQEKQGLDCIGILLFIKNSNKFGHGCVETAEEKLKFMRSLASHQM